MTNYRVINSFINMSLASYQYVTISVTVFHGRENIRTDTVSIESL